MEICTNCAGTLIADVVKCLFYSIKRRVSYGFLHKEKLKNFEKKVENLAEKRDRVQQDVVAAENKGEEIHTDVKNWLNRADNIINAELKEVKGLEDKAKNKCLIGLCPNFKARCQLSKKAEDDAKAVDELLQQGGLDKVSYRVVPPSLVYAPPKYFEAFDSRKQVLSEIVEAVKDPSINIMGVYGMAGVGKTTLVKEVIRQVEENKLFDSVVMVAVTQTPDIKKIQDEFADILGLKFEEQGLTGRATRLYARLKKEKKILVVLDDIWVRLDPMEVGIPFGDEHPGCTMLLTSRDLDVLDGIKSFQIEVLTPNEAWDLFKKMAGDGFESPDLESIAIGIAKKCASLPIAISTVARALRNKPLFAWKDALRQLNKPSSSNFKGVMAEAYSAIELSYNLLDSQENKETFLLCSLMGHDASIRDLLKYAMGLGLFDGVSTVEETRNRLLTVVSHLKASCLLLDSYNSKRFDMHDLICDVAISIASKDNYVFAWGHEDVLSDWPDGERMKECDKISLLIASSNKLPDHWECPKLTFFYMGSKDPSMKIPTNFFKEMKNLKVLDLTVFQFPSLPSSISLPANLRTLCLDQCDLGDIALIGELKNLEILSLLHSDIEMLPMEIGQLIKLKLFDLSHCSKLKRIPSGVLCALSRLEELYMGNSFVRWEAEGHPSEQSNANLAELKALSCLTALDIQIPDANIIPKDFFLEKLQRYNIFIGEAWDWDWDWDGEFEYSRTLKLKLQTSIGFLNSGIKVLLKKAENLHLDEMKGVEVLLKESEARECFLRLKNLRIQNGATIQYIIKANYAVQTSEFLQLKSLTLQGLPKLVSFCSENNGSTSISPQGMALFNQMIVFPKLEKLKLSSIGIERIWLPSGFRSTQNLTSLIIEGCVNLKQVLSYTMVKYLQQLKCLEISECKCIQEIISTEEMKKEACGIRAPISFPCLNSLKLKGLLKLIGFCHEDYIVEFPSLQILKIKHCPELKEFINKSTSRDTSTDEVLFNEKVAFPKLEKITICHLRNVKRIWCNQLYGDSFLGLKELKVESCDALLNIFSSFQLGAFQRLKKLRVTDCASVEEVFQVQGLDTEETCVVVTQLIEVALIRLPKLKYVWNMDPNRNISFENLRQVYVWDCLSLKNLFPFSVAKDLQQLESLTVANCGVEEIVSKNTEGVGQRIWFLFNQLSFLMLWNLPNLICFYPEIHNTMWPVLKKLRTGWCKKIKIFGQVDSQIQHPIFLIEKVIPQLEEVSFSSDDIAMICNGEFAADFFCQIKFLRITCYLNESDVFPFCFLQRFHSLEMLEVASCNFKELTPYEGDVGEEKDIQLPKIQKLKLLGVDKIRYLWKQDSPLDHICASLKNLEVWECDSLINLSSASSSFQYLTTLDVWKCKEMAELITSSKAKSLERLVTIRIRECEMITDVIASEGDEATYEIIFRELKCLELHCLQNLKSFCSGNHTFKFPSLEQVTVSQCPTLKNFCQGALSTPKLQKVQRTKTDYKGHWFGDLNATIEHLNIEECSNF